MTSCDGFAQAGVVRSSNCSSSSNGRMRDADDAQILQHRPPAGPPQIRRTTQSPVAVARPAATTTAMVLQLVVIHVEETQPDEEEEEEENDGQPKSFIQQRPVSLCRKASRERLLAKSGASNTLGGSDRLRWN